MKSVLDKETREELIERISKLQSNAVPVWGKMNVYQMFKHCTLTDESYLGKTKYARTLLGRIFGRRGLANILNPKNEFPKSAPTLSAFIVTDQGDAETQRQKWVAVIKEFENFSDAHVDHWFFGKMTREQIGQFAYKHADHHLRQFNV